MYCMEYTLTARVTHQRGDVLGMGRTFEQVPKTKVEYEEFN